jgi:hypothetical protein
MSNETCDTEILDTTLSMPNIGICEKNGTILLITCFVTFLIQFARHWLWDQTSVAKYNILSKPRKKRCSTDNWKELEPLVRYMAIQLGKTLLWVVSLLIIVNANWLVITIHIVADVFSCCFWILRTQRFDKNPLDVQRIMEAIKDKPEVWEQFIYTSKIYKQFERERAKLPNDLQGEQGHDGAFSNSDSAGAPELWRRTHTLNF